MDKTHFPITMKRTQTMTMTIACRLLWVATAALVPALSTDIASAAQMTASTCGDLHPPGQFGPFDYRSIPPDSKHIVEIAHFTPEVENLRSGHSGTLADDLNYTLRAIPNHPRALLAITRYVLRSGTDRIKGLSYSLECYYERAMRLAPDDPMPHVIYANYLKNRNRAADMKQQLEEAEQLRGDPSSFDFDYNLGLLYLDVGQFDKAAVAAKRAYALGAPFPGLMKRLKAAGKWQE